MARKTGIAWCDSTFNPWIGCTKVSPACDNCYAERDFDLRRHFVQWGQGNPRKRTSEANWKLPLRWNKTRFIECVSCGWRGEEADFNREDDDGYLHTMCPNCAGVDYTDARRSVLCASLADVFDNAVPDGWRMDLFRLIAQTPDLNWLILTKRIGNVRKYMQRDGLAFDLISSGRVWLGISVCNQEEADRDIPKLLDVPAAVRFLSIEPMLGKISLRWLPAFPENAPYIAESKSGTTDHLDGLRRIDWIICGGESGPNARPMHPAWVRGLRDQCAEAGVPFLFKQWGEWLPDNQNPAIGIPSGETQAIRVGKKNAGRLLDGREHNEFPKVPL